MAIDDQRSQVLLFQLGPAGLLLFYPRRDVLAPDIGPKFKVLLRPEEVPVPHEQAADRIKAPELRVRNVAVEFDVSEKVGIHGFFPLIV